MKKWVKIALGSGVFICLCLIGLSVFLALRGGSEIDPATPLAQLSPEVKLRILHFGDVYDI